MKLEKLLYAAFMIPLFLIALWLGVGYAKGFYNWHVWHSTGAEIKTVEGQITAAAPPRRKGSRQHKLVIKNELGATVALYSTLPNELYRLLSSDVEIRREWQSAESTAPYEVYRALATHSKIRSDLPYTAMYTVGITGDNQMFKLLSGESILFEKPADYNNRPEDRVVGIAGFALWFGLAAIFLFMMIKDFRAKEKELCTD